MSTASVTRKTFLAGFLLAGVCCAQNWVIGGGLGYGAYKNATITSPAGTADAGIKSHLVVTGAASEDLYDHFAGEFRYVYQGGDSLLKSGSVESVVKAQSHTFVYDALIHLRPRTERIRPFAAGGVGAKYYDTTGNLPSPQPLNRIASLTTPNDGLKSQSQTNAVATPETIDGR